VVRFPKIHASSSVQSGLLCFSDRSQLHDLMTWKLWRKWWLWRAIVIVPCHSLMIKFFALRGEETNWTCS
jgi:hypothetical protein